MRVRTTIGAGDGFASRKTATSPIAFKGQGETHGGKKGGDREKGQSARGGVLKSRKCEIPWIAGGSNPGQGGQRID